MAFRSALLSGFRAVRSGPRLRFAQRTFAASFSNPATAARHGSRGFAAGAAWAVGVVASSAAAVALCSAEPASEQHEEAASGPAVRAGSGRTPRFVFLGAPATAATDGEACAADDAESSIPSRDGARARERADVRAEAKAAEATEEGGDDAESDWGPDNAARPERKWHDGSQYYVAPSEESTLKLFTGSAHYTLGSEVAMHLGQSLGRVNVSRFADGEVSVKVLDHVRGKDCFVLQPLAPPVNESLMELILLITTPVTISKIHSFCRGLFLD